MYSCAIQKMPNLLPDTIAQDSISSDVLSPDSKNFVVTQSLLNNYRYIRLQDASKQVADIAFLHRVNTT
jgi:hypothetical protein